MKTEDTLFAGFAPVSKEQWKAKITEDLKGADFDKKMVWKTDEGFAVQPFYNAEDTQNIHINQHNPFLSEGRAWVNYVEINVDDTAAANARAIKMQGHGATGLLFNITDADAVNIGVLLNNIDIAKTEISFLLKSPSQGFLSQYFDYLKSNGKDASTIRGFLEYDILENWCATGEEPNFSILAGIIKSSWEYPHFRCLVIRSHTFVNAGSNITQELAFTLNKLTDYIDRLAAFGLKPKTIIDNLALHLAIGGDYFFEIAKHGAIRVLLDNLLKLYKIKNANIRIISSNSKWSKSFYDPNVNMLRNTSEAMSAILGGCDALLSLPHDAGFQQPSDFSTRIALNIANILKEESYFDKVTNPAAGSFYIENITKSITEHTLVLFKEIEEKGGFIKAFENGMIQQKIGLIRDKKEKELASRKRVYVGSNKYPNTQENALLKEENKRISPASLLPEQRATKLFDELRSRTLAHSERTGFVPRVYLACFGNPAMRKARAIFSADFFATAGFNSDEHFFKDAMEAAKESAGSEADIVVICSSDQDYETSAAEFARLFKSLTKDKILVLAGYPETIAEALQQAGVDCFIHIKSNAIEVLSAFQNKLLC